MKRSLVVLGAIVFAAGALNASFHFGLGKAAAKKSAQVIEEAAQAKSAPSGGSSSVSTVITVFSENIPGSLNHSPDGTWWGYNQTKIARYGNTVYTYVIENDDVSAAPSSFTLYQKMDLTGTWVKGASFPTSRPGNIVVDSSGTLHAFVFEPSTITYNDYWGRLKHYWLSGSTTGNITSYQQETVIDNDGTKETVNIRVGAAIGAGDVMELAFGINVFGNSQQTEQLYFKGPNDFSWSQSTAGVNLNHDFYYPFVAPAPWGRALLPVQDDYTGQGNPNIYQKILYFEYRNGSWSREYVADLSSHSLAATRPRLLEQSDLFVDSSGTVHLAYKEHLDASRTYIASDIKYASGSLSGWSAATVTVAGYNMNWLKFIEVNGILYYLFTDMGNVYLMKPGFAGLIKIFSSTMQRIYPYVASPRTGTRASEEYVDILLLEGDSIAYPNAANYYLRIAKSEFQKI